MPAPQESQGAFPNFGSVPWELEFLLGHSTLLNLDDLGHVEAVFNLGISYNDDVWFTGVQGGIKLIITF